MKKIGIIGSGAVAKALGYGFLKYNYQVMLSSHDISKLSEWKATGGVNAHTGSFEDAAKFGKVVILAVRGIAAADAIEEAGPQNMLRKTVIDTTNPIVAAPPENGVIKYFTNNEESLMERLQTRFPEIHFVKAFNSVGNELMVDPPFRDKPTMFICGNNDASKKDVEEILDIFGWDVADMGKDIAARAIEPLCMLWCIPAILHGHRRQAFRLITE